MPDRMVRMGELVASRGGDDVLVSLGLGSCVGVALIDEGGRGAGLAHVVLPESAGGGDSPAAKFADTAVPALAAAVRRASGPGARLSAVLVGGAQMFSLGGAASKLDIGVRNARAAHEALRAAGIPVRAEDTGGTTGRTVRVHVADATVSVKPAGAEETTLYQARTSARRAA